MKRAIARHEGLSRPGCQLDRSAPQPTDSPDRTERRPCLRSLLAGRSGRIEEVFWLDWEECCDVE